ncbi:thioesterase family protein [Gordonia sp. DT30]|uniref:thioesterase family protein n=1 Tax=unclassified Gordonia (in: high G+C Gram-positive bacteria) TaxID=2657482 RepID=UPI003CE70FEC
MESSYYVRVPASEIDTGAADSADGVDYFRPTAATTSPWSADIQHGGPPTGLLMRALGQVAPDPSMHFTRVTTEILGAVGLGVNRVRAQVLRPGRRISVVTAELDVQQPGGAFRTVARAVAWQMRAHDTSAVAQARPRLRPTPDELHRTLGVTSHSSLGVDWGTEGFIGTTEIAVAGDGAGDTPAVWLRPAIELVAGEKTSDLESVMTVVDVANGLGTRLRPDQWTWMNTDTTVHFTAVPTGPWLGIDADLAAGPDGFGATFADLYDVDGFIGRSAQTVLLDQR